MGKYPMHDDELYGGDSLLRRAGCRSHRRIETDRS